MSSLIGPPPNNTDRPFSLHLLLAAAAATMRLAPTALVLASFASVANALGYPGVQNGLEAGQTTSVSGAQEGPDGHLKEIPRASD